MKSVKAFRIRASHAALALLLTFAGILGAQPVPVPPDMPEPRSEHTATALSSADVLIAGGNNANGQIAGTFRYDWVKNLWLRAGNLTTPRFLHTATLLPNGKVLVVGGTNGTALASAEIFDPATNTWNFAPSMSAGRYAHTATLLADGRVLVVGGTVDGSSVTATAEAYDPTANTWTTFPGPNVARFAHTATLLNSGKVLIVGGRFFGAVTGAAELYDPAAHSWTTAASLATLRADHTATLLQNGDVLVMGGDREGNRLNGSVERYDPVGNAWSMTLLDPLYPENLAFKHHTATLLDSGKVLRVGGYGADVDVTHVVALYNPASNRWGSSPEDLATGRWGHSATRLPNGRVLIAGGYRADPGYVAEVALYDPTFDAWVTKLDPRSDRDITFRLGSDYVYRYRSGLVMNPYGRPYGRRRLVPLSDGILVLNGSNIYDAGPGFGFYETYDSFKLTDTGLRAPYSRLLIFNPGETRELADGSIVVTSRGGECPFIGSYTCGVRGDPGPTYDVLRYRRDGTLDASYSKPSHVQAAAILADGTTVSLGATYFNSVVPFTPDRPYTWEAVVFDRSGQRNADLEARFLHQMIRCSPSGTAVPESAGGQFVRVTADDRIIFAYGACVLRLNRDGTPDPTFGVNGLSFDARAGTSLGSVLMGHDGSVLGFYAQGDGSHVVRRLPNGTVDPNVTVVSAGITFRTIDAKGRFLVTGSVADGQTGASVNYIARLDSQMRLDLSFGTAGTGRVELRDQSLGALVPYNVRVDNLGRTVVVSYSASSHNWYVTRLKGDSISANVVEYYNASLEHYFITWKADEMAKLDAGIAIKGWVRTGYAFNAFVEPQPGTVPVCRFYIPPPLGDSHFFGRDTVECSATAQKFPNFVLEDSNFMYMQLPMAGSCPDNTTPIYRVFSNRTDANHRYVTEAPLRDEMSKRGWIAEGDGPDRVVMCAPQ